MDNGELGKVVVDHLIHNVHHNSSSSSSSTISTTRTRKWGSISGFEAKESLSSDMSGLIFFHNLLPPTPQVLSWW